MLRVGNLRPAASFTVARARIFVSQILLHFRIEVKKRVGFSKAKKRVLRTIYTEELPGVAVPSLHERRITPRNKTKNRVRLLLATPQCRSAFEVKKTCALGCIFPRKISFGIFAASLIMLRNLWPPR